MRSNKFLFSALYVIGLGLCIALFLIFVPQEARTNVKWMNFVIGIFVYTGLWGKYSLLYPALGRFADHVPTLTFYWVSFGWYVAATAVAMILFWIFNVGFDKQAILQGCLLFAFVVCIGVGVGASNFMASETGRTQSQINSVREIQLKANQIKIIVSSLPAEYSFVRQEYDRVIEAATYLIGCNNPMARSAETQICNLLDQLSLQFNTKSQADDCLRTIKSLLSAIAVRKTITNV